MNRIKELRKEKNMTISDVSEALNIPKTTLNNYENGKRSPRDSQTWEKLASFFNVSTSYLMGISKQKISNKKALEIAKKKYIELSTADWEIDADQKKAIDYFKNCNLDELLTPLINQYLSIPVVVDKIARGDSEKEIFGYLNTWMPYALWEKYRIIKKTNHNLIDMIYYSLPIDEDISRYKNFETHRKFLSNREYDKIELITYLFEDGIDEQLEKDMIELLKNMREQLIGLKEKYPDNESNVKQNTQALFSKKSNDKPLFWRRIDNQDIEDEVNISEQEKQNLVNIAKELNKKKD
ncbi:helix-turn-helix domain-containing protein [Enterococcus faecalis]